MKNCNSKYALATSRTLAAAGVIDQKVNYIHYNPVEAGFVENDYDYIYSSARDFAEIKGLVKIEKL